MPDDLLLLPRHFAKGHPAGRGLAVSVGLHAAALLALTLHLPTQSSGRGPVRPAPPRSDVRMVVLTPPPTPNAQSATKATPSAPAHHSTAARIRQPAVQVEAAPPARFLEQALRLRQQGKVTPAYAVEDLSPDILRAFVMNGWGRIVVGRPPFSDGFELANWSAGEPSVIHPIGEELRRDLISPRALRLPTGFVASLAGKGAIPIGAEAYLLVTRAVDAALLACQLAAIEDARLAPDHVAVTVGHFAVSGTVFNGLIVTEFELVDGRTIRSPKS